MNLRYDVFELDARGRRRRCIAADQPLDSVVLPPLASRVEAHNTNWDGHCLHWDGVEWQPCPHPIHLARSATPAGALMSGAGRRRHYARAVHAGRQLARSGVTVAQVDAAGITVVIHERCDGGDRIAWPAWSRARLAEAREHGTRARAIGLPWLDLERTLDSTDAEQAQFCAAVYDVATAFRAAHVDAGRPTTTPAMRQPTVVPDLYRAAC